MTSLFANVELAPRDPILGLNEQYNADDRTGKVNLGVGVYYDDEGRIPVLSSVAAVERRLAEDPSPRSYLPMEGLKAYRDAVQRVVFGAGSAAVATQSPSNQASSTSPRAGSTSSGVPSTLTNPYSR